MGALDGIIVDMKKIFAFLMCFMPIAANAFVNRDSAVVRIMNKDAGKVHERVIPVGNEIQFEKMFINVRACKQTDPFDAEDFWAFIEVHEKDDGQIFGGWMSRNEPGQNPLQHPDYDVWLVRCE